MRGREHHPGLYGRSARLTVACGGDSTPAAEAGQEQRAQRYFARATRLSLCEREAANVVNNNLGFGTPLFTVQPSGNVGVGTTATPSRLTVGGGDAYITTAGQGVILKSPNGTVCRRLTIDNTGALITAAIACP